jgi:hypothetical protein
MLFHAILLTIGPEWLYHPLGVCVGSHATVIKCKSYNFHSGIEGNIGELALIGSIFAVYKQHNCKAHWWCPMWGHNKVKGTTAVVCHIHHTYNLHQKLQKLHRHKYSNRLAHGESPELPQEPKV